MEDKVRHLRERIIRLEIALENIIDRYADRTHPNGPICQPEDQTDKTIGRSIEVLGIGYYRPKKTETES